MEIAFQLSAIAFFCCATFLMLLNALLRAFGLKKDPGVAGNQEAVQSSVELWTDADLDSRFDDVDGILVTHKDHLVLHAKEIRKLQRSVRLLVKDKDFDPADPKAVSARVRRVMAKLSPGCKRALAAPDADLAVEVFFDGDSGEEEKSSTRRFGRSWNWKNPGYASCETDREGLIGLASVPSVDFLCLASEEAQLPATPPS